MSGCALNSIGPGRAACGSGSSANLQGAVTKRGTVLNRRFRVERVLGRGGMGTVYLASTPKGAKVAIKELSLLLVDQRERAQAVKQFKAEAELLSQLSHPGLVRVQATFAEQDSHFLVMDYIDGITLAQATKRKKGYFTLDRVMDWAGQLCDVLHYLHTRQPPVIFRDLKPSNVMVDRQSRLRLIDFGIARKSISRRRLIKGVGSAGYAPLEQYGRGTTDPRSDIYSLGATLYTLFTKEIPPPVVSIVAGAESMKSMRSFNPDVPPTLEAIIGRMMALRKEQRYEDMEKVKTFLFDSALEDEEDPTGTMTLAQERASLSELGPCLVCKRVGPEEETFLAPDSPISLSSVDLELPATVILGLKSEPDPQSGLHMQRDGVRSCLSSEINLGFRGAAALVVARDKKKFDGDKMISFIRKQLREMALHLLQNLEGLSPDMRLGAIPVLEDLARRMRARKSYVYEEILKVCEVHSQADNGEVLNQKRLRFAEELSASGHQDDAAKHFALCYDWFVQEARRLKAEGRDTMALPHMQDALLCLHQSGRKEEEVEAFLVDLAHYHRKCKRNVEAPFRAFHSALKSRSDKLGMAKCTLWMGNFLSNNGDVYKGEDELKNALAEAEKVLGEESAGLVPFLNALAQLYSRIHRPEATEMKTRAVLLKYKG